MTILLERPAALAETAAFNPIRPADVGIGRQWTHLVLIALPYETAEDAVLVVSELLGNALLHGREHVTLAISVDHGRIKIEVTDSGTHNTPIDGRPEGEHGRGLLVVESLAAYTTTSTDNGTAVRATMQIPKGSR